jgi:hypothetical protein
VDDCLRSINPDSWAGGASEETRGGFLLGTRSLNIALLNNMSETKFKKDRKQDADNKIYW